MCIAIVGAVISGIAAASSVKREQARADAQADLHERQAKLLRMRGAYEGSRKQEQLDRIGGQQRAGLAASGVSLTDGSAVDIQTDTLTEGNLDIAAIRWNADLAADTEGFKANIERSTKPGGFAVASAFVSPIIQTLSSQGKQAFAFAGG